MTGLEPTEDRLKRLEKEILELKEAKDAVSRREETLIKKLKEYENAFYKELNAQVQVYRQSWTWRIGRLVVDPADWLVNLFRSKKKTGIDKTTLLKSIDGQDKTNQALNETEDYTSNCYNQEFDAGKKDIAVIFDTFTQSCFRPEFNTICFTPSDWKKALEARRIEGLFIESAWRGLNDTWRDKIANISGKNQSEVIKLVGWAKQQNIPTIFWNKEDPVHFEQFIGLAKLFDTIFTTDSDCIPEYQKHAPHASVHPLPFAAQPLIHNPISHGPRNKSVCFAGTYYDQRYHDRRADMDFLLKPSLEYGLEIFDRHFGATGKNATDFKFPGIYQAAIKGKLDYDDMVKAYKQYKVFLNVNSVKYSPTMFARRVFELLASGTPVISTYSQGIVNMLGEGTVFITESEEDTRRHLDHLLGNELNWWKASLNGLRKVMEDHTYTDRTKFIFETAGLDFNPPVPVKFSIVSRVAAMDELIQLEKQVRGQRYTNFDIILVISGEEIDLETQMNDLKSRFSPLTVTLFSENGPGFENKIMATDSDYFAIMHPDHYYGPNYLRDFSSALKYTNAPVLGKKSHFRASANGALELIDKGFEYHYVTNIPNATSIHRKRDINVLSLKDCLGPGEFIDPGSGIFSLDPFNYLCGDFAIKQGILTESMIREINL